MNPTTAADRQLDSFCVRPARGAEIARLREIAAASKGHWGYDAEAVTRWASSLALTTSDRERELWVADVRGDPVAWMRLLLDREPVWLDDLWVMPEWIGKGIGSKLFSHALDRAHAQQARSMAWEAEPNALRFYERQGGRATGEIRLSEWGREIPVMAIAIESVV